MKQATFIALRALLADFYQDIATIRRVLHDAGLDLSRIPLNAAPLDLWDAVLTEAMKSGKIADLLVVVKGEYGANPGFQAIYDSYLQEAALMPVAGQPLPATPGVWAKGRAWVGQRPIHAAGAVALLIGLFVLVWLLRPDPPAPPLCPTDRHCLLVAAFAPADQPLAGEITRKIKTELDSQEQLSPNQFAVRQAEAVTDADTARQLANREQALVVVWGEIFSALKEVKIFVAVTDQFGVGESHQVRPYRVEFFESIAQQIACQQRCFEDVATLATAVDQISTVIAYTAAGLLHYANDQPEAANRDFTAALLCSGQPVDLPLVDPAITPATPITITSPPATGSDRPTCATDQPIPGFNPAAIYYYAGKAKILVGDYGTAIAYLQQAAQLNPKDPAAPIAIATAYQSWLNQTDAAQVKTYLAQARQRANALRAELLTQGASAAIATVDYTLGFIAEVAGGDDELMTAQEKYAAAADGFGRSNPAAYVSLLALGRVQRLAGQVDAASATLQEAIDLDQTAPWAYLELAQRYSADRDQVERQMQTARQASPNQPAIAIAEAAFCEQWLDQACAERAYTRAVEQRPTSGWLQGRIGDFYRSREDWEQATTHYALAVQFRPNDTWAHDRLAFAYLQSGNYAEAAKHYALTLDLSHPQNRLAERYCALGQAQEWAGEPQAALGNYRICVAGLKDDVQRAMVTEWIAAIEASQ